MSELVDEAAAVWRLMLASTAQAKVSRLVERVGAALAVPVEVLSSQPYWKEPSTREVRVRTQLGPVSPAEAVFEVLTRGRSVAHGWSTSGPQVYDDGRWEFEAIANGGFAVSGVTWALVRAANFAND